MRPPPRPALVLLACALCSLALGLAPLCSAAPPPPAALLPGRQLYNEVVDYETEAKRRAPRPPLPPRIARHQGGSAAARCLRVADAMPPARRAAARRRRYRLEGLRPGKLYEVRVSYPATVRRRPRRGGRRARAAPPLRLQ